MSLDLHEECKRRLREELIEQLPKLSVRHRFALDRDAIGWLYLIDSVLPNSGPIARDIERFVGDYPFKNFVDDFLNNWLLQRLEFAHDPEVEPLCEVPGFDLARVAHEIVEEFSSLPWHYTISLMLPNGLQPSFDRIELPIKLSGSVRLVRADGALSSAFSIGTGNERLDQRIHWEFTSLLNHDLPDWEDGQVYIQIDTEGFVDRGGFTLPFVNVDGMLKSFFGLGIAMRVFDVRQRTRDNTEKRPIYIHRRHSDAASIVGSRSVNEEWMEVYHNIVRDTDGEEDWDEESTNAWVAVAYKKMAGVIGQSGRYDRILQAARWLFDSYTGRNELLSFVQTMVAIEILLGDKAVSDLVGLGELLRNRCAYLVGRTHDERAQIMKEFSQIYDLRSKIVHRGKSRLSAADRVMSSKLRTLCKRVIQAEVRLAVS